MDSRGDKTTWYVLFSKYMGGNPVYLYKVGLDRL